MPSGVPPAAPTAAPPAWEVDCLRRASPPRHAPRRRLQRRACGSGNVVARLHPAEVGGQRAPHRCAPCSRAAPRVLLPMKTAMGLLIAHSNPESVLSAPGAVYISRHGRGVAETRLAPVSTLPRPGAPEEDPARPSSECLSASYGPVSLMAMQPVTPALHFTLLPFILRVEVGRRSCRIDPRRKNPSFFGIKVCLGSTHASTLSIQPLQFNFSNILCDSLLDEHR